MSGMITTLARMAITAAAPSVISAAKKRWNQRNTGVDIVDKHVHGIISTRNQPLIDWADSIAEKAHRGQHRKGKNGLPGGEPYIVHPRGVAKIVASVTDDVNMICACLLHDTVEDTDMTFKKLIALGFGYPIVRLVDGLTDPKHPRGFNRSQRIEANRMHTAAQSADVHTCKLADLIHNTSNIAKLGGGFADQFMYEKALQMGYLIDGHPLLVERAFSQLAEFYGNKYEPTI